MRAPRRAAYRLAPRPSAGGPGWGLSIRPGLLRRSGGLPESGPHRTAGSHRRACSPGRLAADASGECSCPQHGARVARRDRNSRIAPRSSGGGWLRSGGLAGPRAVAAAVPCCWAAAPPLGRRLGRAPAQAAPGGHRTRTLSAVSPSGLSGSGPHCAPAPTAPGVNAWRSGAGSGGSPGQPTGRRPGRTPTGPARRARGPRIRRAYRDLFQVACSLG
jgi:hypothetical protein